ncbi:MAG: HlyD family efflux transporter periplasmic adaptor subunit [Muribaculum sp.]|nr:HlyD family efflux transporter periplasmic adaptor subunit [Muribaculaceae bacterium]MCM1080671.1 HlyD family efflux transporter periplasmic adaptor subunit [Muribaculum sp.]
MDEKISSQEIKRARMKRLRKVVIAVVVIAAVIVVAVMVTKPGIKKNGLKISTVEVGNLATTIPATGDVVPAFEEIINSPITTKVLEVYCKLGDSVDVGTPLLRLDLQTADAERRKLADQCQVKNHEIEQVKISDKTFLSNLAMQIKVREMSVNKLYAELKNERRLDSLGSGTGDRVREAEFAYKTGVLELEQLRNQLVNETSIRDAGLKMKRLELSMLQRQLDETDRMIDEAQVKSPRKAVLTAISNEIGQQIQQGQKLAIVSDLSHFKVECTMSDAYADSVYVGSPVFIKLNREKITGKVSNLTPLSRNGSMAFTVTPDNDHHPRLRSGQKPEVYVQCGVIDSVMHIKNAAYYTGPGQYKLFVLTSDNEAELRKVKLGSSNFESVEVISGLEIGDRVIISDMKSYMSHNKLNLK